MNGREIQPGLFSIPRLPHRQDLLALSETTPGNLFRSNLHVSHVQGRKHTTYLLETALPDVLKTKPIVETLIGKETGFSYSRMARDVLSWLDIDCPRPPKPTVIVPPDSWHYQECKPGHYPAGTMYDMRAAYWQVLERAKSPCLRVDTDKRRIIWLGVSNPQEDRFARMKAALADCKTLRLILIGQMVIGWDNPQGRGSTEFFHKGETRRQQFPGGTLASLGLLTVRASYELTQMQARQGNSVYSNADCVVLEGGYPQYWKDYGIEFRTKGDGPSDIVGIGTYRVGRNETKTYPRYSRNDEGFPHASRWLTPWYHEELAK